MTKLLRDALRQVELLPEAEQDAAAGALLDYLAHRNDLRLSDEQLAEIRCRRADPNRKLVSHDEARARIGRLGACGSSSAIWRWPISKTFFTGSQRGRRVG